MNDTKIIYEKKNCLFSIWKEYRYVLLVFKCILTSLDLFFIMFKQLSTYIKMIYLVYLYISTIFL